MKAKCKSWKSTKHLLFELIVGSSPGRVKPKTVKLVFASSPLSTQQLGERAKTGWLGIRIMYPSGVTCHFIHSKHFLDPVRVSLKIWTGIPLLCYHFILVKAKCKSLKEKVQNICYSNLIWGFDGTSIILKPEVQWLACSLRVWYIVGSSPDRVKPKTVKLVFVTSPVSTHHLGERAKTGWLEIRIMWRKKSLPSERRGSTVWVSASEWLLFNANSTIFQLYHGENKLISNEMMVRSALY
jgi:hypothetical protein